MLPKPAADRSRSDSAWVAKAAKGDAEAWGELVRKYSAYVASLIKACRVPEGDQADAFQHVFVELYRSLASIQNPDNVAPWIRMTTIRHSARIREKLGRTQSFAEGSEAETIAELEGADDALLHAEQGLLVRQSLEALSEKCRRLVQMLFYEDPPRPYTEVAQELGLQTGSLGMTRQRCLDALQKELEKRGIP